ncbi:TRAP transporter, DctQ subunit [Oceaniovalibus guishaninsula JLT2003]|uniref:TRAP transporter small permease protein n=1 Tax=Oceaniovalibus guishaninsula JLT2003 TaxID=1231392 RepID=K2HT46_9RHOB|nr:TRAP transporter small permease [Oceaniovalibus guishaninsula]EKE45799.1 TRAP transporter, DctQ subunit [Oceaniovalibus guishaninsula JLT2003]
MSAHRHEATSGFGHIVTEIEETAIALLLGLMTLVTFVNVVLRYGFNHSLIWGLELVLILFAWLVIFGVSYAFKVTANLGVDAVTGLLKPRARRVCALLSALVCLAYGVLLLKGAWDFWAPFAGLDRTAGRWFPLGFEETRSNSFYVTDRIPIPFGADWLSRTFNSYMDGNTLVVEAYDKLPRFIPYLILPFGCALILLRMAQATWRIARGRQESLIVSHEVEDAVNEASITLKDA